ncbi:MAG: CZB domain-containing protein [Nitrospirae bacterium]|nr:CZB domain-containing protein [Nitrospirota bacterium]MCL5977514.1 CZB domain-containing protein [Nitrospirota bacterium]
MYSPDELQADKSRMGRWYYGDGRELFGSLGSFKELEDPHKRLHELGFKAYESAKGGNKESVKQYIMEIVKIVDEIILILEKLESQF